MSETQTWQPDTALRQLVKRGASYVNPAALAYLQSLQVRATRQRTNVAQQLESKLLAACRRLDDEITKVHSEAETIHEVIVTQYPQAAERASTLLEARNYPELRKLKRELAVQHRSLNVPFELKGLNDLLLQSKMAQPEDCSLQGLLAQQEIELLGGQEGASLTRQQELPAFRKVRDTLAQLHAERAVERAVSECPKDAGPLNTQRLLVATLKTMQALSPAYTKRFVSLADTITRVDSIANSKGS